jgi:signal transduction histidine kinase
LNDSQLKFDQAVNYYRKALEYDKKYGTKFSQISALTNLSISQRRLKKFPEALASLFQAKAISDSLNNDYFKQSILQNIGEVAYDNKDYKTAETYILQALKNSKNNAEPVLRTGLITLLKKIYAKNGDYKTALMYADSLAKLNDGIFSKEKIALTGEIETKYQVALKDDKLAKQALLAANQQQEIESKRHLLELSSKENEIQKLALSHQKYQLENDRIKQAGLRENQALVYKLNNQKKNKQISWQRELITKSEIFKTLVLVILGFVAFVAVLMFYSYNKSKKLNRIISAQKHDVEIVSQVKDRLFSVVSHDMRAPINTLIAFTQLLDHDDVSADSMKMYATQLKSSLNHTSVLMENLLNWASSQMQGFKPFIQVFDVNIIAGEALSALKDHAARKNITLKNDISSGTLVMADINMLQLVLRNLISNAIKFTQDNGTITLNAAIQGADVSIIVEDNGVGMKEKNVLEFNDNNYSQFSESTPGTNNEKGTGLGLVLCKNFTLLMNGTIKVESHKNKGTTFSLTLPKSDDTLAIGTSA